MQVDLVLIVLLLKYVCKDDLVEQSPGSPPAAKGALLVFLPGWDEIVRLKDQLEGGRDFPHSK